MTKKMKRWLVSKWWLGVTKDKAIATYKEETESHGWWPDGIVERFDNKEEAEAFFKAQCKTLESFGKCCEIAVMTECAYEMDVELGGEWDHEYTDLAIAVGK